MPLNNPIQHYEVERPIASCMKMTPLEQKRMLERYALLARERDPDCILDPDFLMNHSLSEIQAMYERRVGKTPQKHAETHLPLSETRKDVNPVQSAPNHANESTGIYKAKLQGKPILGNLHR